MQEQQQILLDTRTNSDIMDTNDNNNHSNDNNTNINGNSNSNTSSNMKSKSVNHQNESSDQNQKKQAANAAWQMKRKYTLSEVQQHSTLEDCWMVIFDKVYDLTDFVYKHPGGDFILFEYAGQDATHPFLSSRHGSLAYKMLDKYWIGILVDEELYYSNNSSYCSVYSNLSWPTSTSTGDDDEDEVDDDDDDDDEVYEDSSEALE